jgi:acyl-CoA oxidase
VRAEIASGAEAARQDEAREAQRAARASGAEPVPEPKPSR